MALASVKYLFGTIHMYAVMIFLGIVAALLVSISEEKRKKLPKDTVIDFSLWAIPIGIVGTRLYYVLFNISHFAKRPLEIFYIWNGGLAIYGGIIAGILVMIIFCKKKNIKLAVMLDTIIIGVILAQAIGRWGNYFNIEAYGREVTNKSLQFFPFAILVPQNGSYTWHMATFFYEFVWNIISFFIIWCKRKKLKKDGDAFLYYLLLYGIGRSIIEGLRTDSLYIGDYRVSQLLSIAMWLIASTIFIYRLIKYKNLNNVLIIMPFTYLFAFYAILKNYNYVFIALIITIFSFVVYTLIKLNSKPRLLVANALLVVISFAINLKQIFFTAEISQLALLVSLITFVLSTYNFTFELPKEV